jgi:hypothetical protein
MATAKIALLPDRGVIGVEGEDAAKLLQGVITNDMAAFEAGAAAIHAGLLSAQGKVLHAFFVVRRPGAGPGFLIETRRDATADLVKRLLLYKLRAKAEIKDLSSAFSVAALWGGVWAQDTVPWPWDSDVSTRPEARPLAFKDPRHTALGARLILSMASDWAVAETGAAAASADDYHAHRIALGVPEAGRDYPLGDAFPHEADFDLLAGVSFTKGCFVGQEVVARMQHKSVVRKRVVRVEGDGMTPGADVLLGDVPIGRIGSVAGARGLALIRLDRVAEGEDAGTPITAGGRSVTVDPEAVARYRASAAEKAAGQP